MAKRTAKKKGRTARTRTTAEQIDQEIAQSARTKRAAGRKPTERETAALRRVERAEDERRRWQLYERMPKKDWFTMSKRGRQTTFDLADRYGFPLRDRTVNLPAVVGHLYDFLAKHGRRLLAPESEDEMLLSGTDTPALERIKRKVLGIKAERDELKLNMERGELIDVEKTRRALGQMSHILRSASDALQKQFGQEAHRILDDALEEVEQIGIEIFGEQIDGEKGKTREETG